MIKGLKRISAIILIVLFILLAFFPGVYGEDSSAQLEPIVTFMTDVYYNGQEQALATITGASGGPDLQASKISISYRGRLLNGDNYAKTETAPVDAGIYTVTVSYSGDENYQNISVSNRVTLNQMVLSYDGFETEAGIEKIYDGNTELEKEVISGLSHKMVLSQDKDQLIFDFKTARFYNQNVQSDNFLILSGVSISGDRASNYTVASIPEEKLEVLNEKLAEDEQIKSNDCFLDGQITERPVGIFLTGADKTYDGTPNLLSYGFAIDEEDLVSGDSISIETNSAFAPWYGDETNRIKDVGEYRVFAQEGFSIVGLGQTLASNYRSERPVIYSRLFYEINPVEIVVEPTFRYKYDGDDDPPLTYSIWRVTTEDRLLDGLFGDDVLYGSLTREKGEIPGKYDIYQGDLNNGNYIIYFQNGEDKFEIRDREDVVETISGNDYDASGGGGIGGWTEEISPTEAFGGVLILLIVVVAGIFFIRSRMSNFD
ncbi:YDG domain-containing protein [Eubacteriaceae bacterium ES2]|nr:YDG domain-containing protein [Eubacteriaceae bacterium ES2]